MPAYGVSEPSPAAFGADRIAYVEVSGAPSAQTRLLPVLWRALQALMLAWAAGFGGASIVAYVSSLVFDREPDIASFLQWLGVPVFVVTLATFFWPRASAQLRKLDVPAYGKNLLEIRRAIKRHWPPIYRSRGVSALLNLIAACLCLVPGNIVMPGLGWMSLLFLLNGARIWRRGAGLLGYLIGAPLFLAGVAIASAGALLVFALGLAPAGLAFWAGFGLTMRSDFDSDPTPILLSTMAFVIIYCLALYFTFKHINWFHRSAEAVFAAATAPGFGLLVTPGLSLMRPSGLALLRHDKRPPILFVRAFRDDARTAAPTTSEDREVRLEDAMAREVMQYGPFIGIAQPGSFYRESGAARLSKKDDEWQSAVTEIMDRARLIVAIAGWTKGLQWEFGRLSQSDHTKRLILIFPPDAQHHSARCDWVRYMLGATEFGKLLRHADLSTARAAFLTSQGLVVVTAARGTEAEYQAALFVALYGLLPNATGQVH